MVLGLVLALAVGTVVRRRGASYQWRMGAVGERRTGRRLNALRRRGWVVFHDLSLPGSRANVDHLVIGTSGVYLVDSKYRRGAVRFGGRRGWIRIGKTGGPLLVRSAQYEAEAVTRVLSSALGRRVDVTAVLAVHVPRSRFPGWREFSASGVPIMAASAVVPWLRARRVRVFSAAEVVRVAEVVRERLPAYRNR
ncbi:nuclease-related domain-containing protein [Nocardiopsis deserti]|uniref:nuclease-related domain-containing protein n=1 Tax=Nocardiopsis deserti TaxID=2605988 RepID=UPI00167FF875|nr:nuclease-related domain-containing protein [Nocardiopsis deserti]